MKLELQPLQVRPNLLSHLALLVLLLLFTVGVTVSYVSSQHAFLGGDINDGFCQRAIEVTDLFRQSPWQAIQDVFQAANATYNKFYILPIIPLLLLLGNSYLAYVISVAIVYLLPLNLMMGVLATQLIPAHPRAVFMAAVFISTLVAPNWVTVLMGHPDIGATLVVTIALWVCLQPFHKNQFNQNQKNQSTNWLLPYRWQVPVLGILLAVAILFRRHFAYADLALVGAMVGHTAIEFSRTVRRETKAAWASLFGFAVRLGLVLATCLATLAIIAPQFTQAALSTDFVSLYDSWSRTVPEAIGFYSTLYGCGMWLLVLVGWGAGFAARIVFPVVGRFMVLYGGGSIGIWLFKLRYTETYYAIHFVPILTLGLVALVWAIWRRLSGAKRLVFLSLFSLYVGFNFLVCLTPIGAFQTPIRPWFALNYPPPVRQNYDAVVQVVRVLRDLAPHQEPIFVVHSGGLPQHLLEAAEKTVYGKTGKILRMRSGSVIDSIGYYSIQELLEAEYVVITQPFLAWHNGQQDSAKVVIDAFAEQWEITQDFQKLPQPIDLQDGTTTSIYKRIQPTSIDRAIRTLHTMQQRVNKPLGKQLDWVILSPPFHSTIKPGTDHRYTIRLKPVEQGGDPISPQSLLYLGQLTSSEAEIKGKIQFNSAHCNAVTLNVAALNAQGGMLSTVDPILFLHTSPLKLTLPTPSAAYLLLQVSHAPRSPNSIDRCVVRLNHLQVSSQVK